MGRHGQDKPWWSEVRNVTVEQHPTRQAALDAERVAIASERPRHNVHHQRRMCAAPAAALRDHGPACVPCTVPAHRNAASRAVGHPAVQQAVQRIGALASSR